MELKPLPGDLLERVNRIAEELEDITNLGPSEYLPNEVLCYTGRLKEMRQKMDLDNDGRIGRDEFRCFFASLFNAGTGKIRKVQTGKLLKVEATDAQGTPCPQWHAEANAMDKGWYDVNTWLEFLEGSLNECRSLYNEDMRVLYGDDWRELTLEQRRLKETENVASHGLCGASLQPRMKHAGQNHDPDSSSMHFEGCEVS